MPGEDRLRAAASVGGPRKKALKALRAGARSTTIAIVSISFMSRRASCLLCITVAMSSGGCGGGAPPAREPLLAPQIGGRPAATADTCGDAQTCTTIGVELAKRGEDARATVALEKGCALRDIDACAALTALQQKETSAGHATATAHKGCRIEGASKDTRAARGAACRVWAEAVQRDSAPGADLHAALVAFEDGCTLGDARSCASAQLLKEQRAFDAETKQYVGQPNVHAQFLTSAVATKVACRADLSARDPADMFADQTLLEDREAAFEACAANGATDVRFVWSADASHKVTMVKVVSGDGALGACIKQALLGARARRIETCIASSHPKR
jgi:hypothetical protein